MKSIPTFSRILIGLLLTILLTAPLTIARASKSTLKAERKSTASTAVKPAADTEEFRNELSNFFGELEATMRLFNSIPAVRQRFERAGLRNGEMIFEARQKLSQLTPLELGQMKAVYDQNPGWQRMPATLGSLIKPALRSRPEQQLAAQKSGLIRVTVADNCQDGLDAGITNTDISIAAAVVIAADALMEGFPTDGVSIAARIAPIAAKSVADAALLALETLKGIKDDCNGDAFESAIQQQVADTKNSIINNDNANTTSIISNVNSGATTIIDNDNTNTAAVIANNNANTTSIINNDNSNKTAIINNDNANLATTLATLNQVKAELRDLILRTQIEADLAEADNASPVALYLTPTAQGGHLDLVQTIVTQTLSRIVAAGGSAGTAQSFLDKANADKAAGKFKSAYDNYRKAYKAAAH